MASHLPGRRVVAPDQRAHGRSSGQAVSTAGFAADAIAVADAAGIERFMAAGHSWGAAVALEIAVAFPDRVWGLAFVDGLVRPLTELGSFDQAASMLPEDEEFASVIAAAAGLRQSLGCAWGEDLLPMVARGLDGSGPGFVRRPRRQVQLAVLRDLYRGRPDLAWRRTRPPVLLAMAERSSIDAWKRVSVASAVASAPHLRVSWHACGHDIPLERPAELAAEIAGLSAGGRSAGAGSEG